MWALITIYISYNNFDIFEINLLNLILLFKVLTKRTTPQNDPIRQLILLLLSFSIVNLPHYIVRRSKFDTCVDQSRKQQDFMRLTHLFLKYILILIIYYIQQLNKIYSKRYQLSFEVCTVISDRDRPIQIQNFPKFLITRQFWGSAVSELMDDKSF